MKYLQLARLNPEIQETVLFIYVVYQTMLSSSASGIKLINDHIIYEIFAFMNFGISVKCDLQEYLNKSTHYI